MLNTEATQENVCSQKRLEEVTYKIGSFQSKQRSGEKKLVVKGCCLERTLKSSCKFELEKVDS